MVCASSKVEPKFSSSSFVIRINLLHPEPSLFLYGSLLIISLVFFNLSKILFSGFLQFKGNFLPGQNDSK